MSRILDVARSIDDVLVAQDTLRRALKPGHPPFGAFGADGKWERAPHTDAIRRYGSDSPLTGLWLALARLEALRVAWTGKPGAVLELTPEEPDEAPGLTVEVPPAPDEGAEGQPRLTAGMEAI
jgi:hypothetical protein